MKGHIKIKKTQEKKCLQLELKKNLKIKSILSLLQLKTGITFLIVIKDLRF